MKILFTFIAITLTAAAFAQKNIDEARNFREGDKATISGIVTNGDELGLVRYVQDATAGIAVYDDDGKLSGVKRGDSITVTGEIHPYNNLFEITDVSNLVVHSPGHRLPEPRLLTVDEIGEEYEGQLIRINNAVISNANGTFSGNKNYEFGVNGKTAMLRIVTACPIVGEVIPTNKFNLVAILSQYSFSDNDTRSGYQLLPRDLDDFITASPINITSPLEVSNITKDGFTLRWRTDVASSSEVNFGSTQNPSDLSTTVSGTSFAQNVEFVHEVTISGLSPAEIIYAQAFSVIKADTASSSVGTFATQSNSSGEIKVYFNTPVAPDDWKFLTKNINDPFKSGDLLSNQNLDIGENMEDTVIAYINRAAESVDFCIYNLNNNGLSNVSEALNNAHNRGVKVRVITSGSTNHVGTEDLISQIPVLESPYDTDDGIMHNKFAVIDAKSTDPNKPWVWTGSLNISFDQVNRDAQNILFIQDQTLAKAYTIEFEEMWGSSTQQKNLTKSKFGAAKSDNTPHEFVINGKRVECYFSPSDNTNQKIIDAINTANHDLEVETMLITRSDIALAIKNAKLRGVDVQVITNYINDNSETVNTILNETLPIGKFVYDDVVAGILHHKLAIVDARLSHSDPQVITGSHNWSNSANDRNDENTLIIHDSELAHDYLRQFAQRFMENGGDMAVSAKEFEFENVTVYPNPAVGTIHISSTFPIEKIQLFSITGEKIKTKEFHNSNHVEFDMANYEPGIYLLQVNSTKREINTYKIIKK